MAAHRALLTEAFWLVITNFFGLAVGLVGTILVTRALGPEARGIYAWVMTISAVATQVATLVPYNTVRQLGSTAGSEKNWANIAGTLTGLSLLGWMLTFPIMGWALCQPLGSGPYAKLVLLAWAGIPLLSLGSSINALVHLRRRWFDIIPPTLLPRLLITALIFEAWALHLLTLGMAIGLGVLLSAIGLLFGISWLNIPLKRWHIDKTLVRQAARFVGATWAASLMAFAAPKIVLLILPHYTGLAQLGYYSIAATLLDVALMLPNAVSAVLISHFTRGESNATNKRNTLFALLVLMAGAGVFGAVTAPYLLPFIFGPAFIATVAPFRILLLVLLIQAPLTVYTSQLVARTKAAGLLIPPFSSLLATAAGAFWLIPAYGINGAAMAVVAGYAIQLLTTLPFSLKSAK